MNISTKRSGCAFLKSSAYVEFETSPSSTTTSPRSVPSAASASPYALRVETFSSEPHAGHSGEPVSKRWDSPFSGRATSTRMLRMPPSSSIASSETGLPCQPFWFSTFE